MSTQSHNLTPGLSLKWIHGSVYEATVTATILDTCYRIGELKIGLPHGVEGAPDIEYLTLNMTHEGKVCGDIAREVTRSIDIPSLAGKREVTAYTVLNGKVSGHLTKPVPKHRH
jgi:hypothetical protein